MSTPSDTRLTRWLEIVANVATVVICLVLVVWWMRGDGGGRAPAAEPAPAVGQRLTTTSLGELRDTSLLLFLRTDCRFCTASADFYKRLNAATNRVPLVAVFGEPEDVARQYLDGLGVAIADLRRAEHRTFGVAATPVALLVDAGGIVKGRWVGRLGPDGENELLLKARLYK